MKSVRAIVCVYFLPFLLPISGYTQERAKAEDLLRYFPEGRYESIQHQEPTPHVKNTDLPSYKRFIAFKKSLTKKVMFERRFLPDLFYSSDYSVTSAKLTHNITKREKVTFQQNEEGYNKLSARIREKYPRSNGWTVNPAEDGTALVLINIDIGDQLHVYRFQDLPALISAALENDDIEKTEYIILKLPVYSFRGRYRRVENTSFFLYATALDELLISTRLEGLQKMVEAAEGLITNMLAQEEYVHLMDVIPDLQGEWQIFCYSQGEHYYVESAGRVSTAKVHLERDDLPDEQRKLLETMVASRPLFRVIVKDFGDEILQKEITIYSNEEYARNAFDPKPHALDKNRFVNQPEAFFKMREMELAKTSYGLDGPWIIKTVLMDEEFLKNQFEYYSSMIEQREKELQKAKEQEKK